MRRFPFASAFLAFGCAALTNIACSGAGEGTRETAESHRDPLAAGSNAAGAIPAGIPARMMTGLFEDHAQTWMKSSGVRWDVRYAYFVKGWQNNFGYGANDGSLALDYMREADAIGAIPSIMWYVVNDEPPAYDESKFYWKTTQPSLMNDYFGQFKVMLQRAKDFGKPVVIMLEGDGFGYMEAQSGGNPNAYAAVAASGVPELAGLPNTVAGWGLAFLQLRKAVGATNVIMGPNVSEWASGKDLSYFQTSDPLQPEVDKVYSFLAPMGLAANQTGQAYDILVAAPGDRDCDYWRSQGQDKCWDASDSASIDSKSFNRYAEWLRLWNQKTQKRWFLWQIPIGNSNHLDVNNDGQPRHGWKDNRAEYFFGPSRDAHLAKFADAGVVALLFGAGAGGQSSYENDQYSDGQLFLKSRVGALAASGGFPITRGGGSSGTADAGTGTADAGTGPVDSGTRDSGSGSTDAGKGTTSDPAAYNFEGSAQGWASSGGMITGVAPSAARAFAGAQSLAVTFNGAAGTQQVRVLSPSTPAGATVTFHVWCPAGSAVTSIQPFVLQGAAGNWAWTGTWRAASSLSAGAWNTVTVAVPTNAAALYSLGVELTTGSTWSGTCYVDSVGW